jgi:hypothetical protein
MPTRVPSGLKAAEDTPNSCPRSTAIPRPLSESQSRAALSSDAVTMRVPSGLKAAEDTPLLCPRRTAISLPLAASQMRAVLSPDAVTIRLPSGLKAAEDTLPPCPRRTAISLTVATSQMRALLSHDAVTMRVPSRLKAAEVILPPMCPRSTAIAFPRAASQMRAVLSFDAVTMRVPSGLKAAEDTPNSCPRSTAIPRPLSESQSRELGEQPTILTMPTREGKPIGVIATWGKVVLEPVDAKSQPILAAGKNPKIGVLIDFIGNFERSIKNNLPVYRVSGGAGFIWAASWDSNSRGTFRMLAVNPSELPTPANMNPSNQAGANQLASNPLASLAQKSLDEALGTGFFVSADGHILTDGFVVRECRDITSSHGGHIKKIAFDETSDLALLMSSEKPSAWASLRGGDRPRVAEPVMTMKSPVATISALAGLGNDRRMIQISTPTQMDNTGSPLLDLSGNVVGIVGELNAIQVAETTNGITENANFAVNLGTIQTFLDSHAVPYVLNDSIESKTYADIAAEAMRYTVLLECVR